MLEALIAEYAREHVAVKSNSNIELEVRFSSISKEAFVDLYTSLMKRGYVGELEQSINTISSNVFERSEAALPRNTQYIRHMEFNGKNKIIDTYMTKTPIKDVRVRAYLDHKIALSKETQSIPFTASQNSFIRFKIRVSFTHVEFPNWRIDVTATASTQLSAIGAKLPQMRDSMFVTNPPMNAENLLDVIDFSLVEQFEVEIEHIGDPAKLTVDDINVAIEHIYGALNPNWRTEIMFQEEVYEVATRIVPNKHILGMFKTHYGLKQLTNQAKALMKTTYREIYPPMNHYITEKADGIRCVVSISGGRCRLIADTLEEFGDPNATGDITIADAELLRGDKYGDSGDLKLMLFDVMWLRNEDLTNKPFTERYEHLEDAAALINQFVPCVSKNFIQLNEQNLEDAFVTTWEQKYDYSIDGIVITSPNDSYANTSNYKWKPPHLNTIDFLAVECPRQMLNTSVYRARAGFKLYLLFVSVTPNLHRSLGIDLIPEYRVLFPDIDPTNTPVYPIQFATADTPLAYLFYYPESESNIDRKIVELGKEIKDPSLPQTNSPWKLIHVREDRSFERNYYGNNYKIADIIWQNFVAPFPLNNLWDLDVGYFQNVKDDTYRALTAFHSYIKSQLTQKYFENKKYVMDLASGRGADLARYQNVGVGNTIFVDADRVALTELINRKYHLIEAGRSNRRLHRERNLSPMTIHVLVADLTTPAEEVVSQLSVFGAPNNRVDVVAMHMAIHYMCGSVAHIRNLLSLVSTMLKKGGVFVFTTMDGQRVFDKLADYKNNAMFELKENNMVKYAIRKKYSGNKLSDAGQIVSVKLPFAGGGFYDEPLANIATIIEHAEEFGFKVVANESFESMLGGFERNNRAMFRELSNADREYTALHQYVVLTLDTQH